MKERSFLLAPAVTLVFGPSLPLARAASYANVTGTATFNVALQATCTIARVGIQKGVQANYMSIRTGLAPFKHGCDASQIE